MTQSNRANARQCRVAARLDLRSYRCIRTRVTYTDAMPAPAPGPAHPDSPDALPIMLRLDGRRCVIVGGGAVAARRAATLLGVGAQVVVIAPAMHEKLDQLLIERIERGYETGDLDGAFLVVVATDNPAVNQRVADDAVDEGCLVNRADDAGASGAGDFTFMGHDRRGPLTIAVDSGHSSAAAGKLIRQQLLDALDDDWITLLTEARPWRAKLRRSALDAPTRTARLRGLIDDRAMRALKKDGVTALRAHLQRIVEGQAPEAALHTESDPA